MGSRLCVTTSPSYYRRYGKGLESWQIEDATFEKMGELQGCSQDLEKGGAECNRYIAREFFDDHAHKL